jgi:hypothetical protein
LEVSTLQHDRRIRDVETSAAVGLAVLALATASAICFPRPSIAQPPAASAINTSVGARTDSVASSKQEVAMRTIHDVIQRIRAEYLEMPGLQLKTEQVQRLCGIERAMCQPALDALVNAKFLYVKPDGRYARLTEGHFSRPHPAKAVLRIGKQPGEAFSVSEKSRTRRSV